MTSRRRTAAAFLVLSTVALLTGCGTTVDVAAPQPRGQSVQQCRDLLDVLPGTLDGADRADVRPQGAAAAAWGDPAIVLRCGVDRPAALVPTSACYTLSGVDWLATVDGHEWPANAPTEQPVTFTTIHRSTFVEVTVPPDYAPQADALTELAAPITQATRATQECE